MIYVISKSTYGPYSVRDIQCNANWNSCPYSDYARIPDSMVDDILATKGYCDITVNNSNEVTAFTPRSIPDVEEECCGTNTVLSVNGVCANNEGNVALTPAAVGAAPAIESADHPGCYYRHIDDEVEWINPPLLVDTEYRTPERWNGQVVYTQMLSWTVNYKTTSGANVFSDRATCLVRSAGWLNGNEIASHNGLLDPSIYRESYSIGLNNFSLRQSTDTRAEFNIQVWYTKV